MKILSLLIFLSCFTGCDAPQKGRHDPETRYIGKNYPVQESWNISLVVSDSGLRQALVTAGHAAVFQQGKEKEQYLDKGLSAEFYDGKGVSATKMTAGRAVIHNNQDIEAFDNVVIHSGDATEIRTEYIKRTASDRMLRSDKYVTITKPSETIRGYGFQSDEHLRQYKIFRASGESLSK